MMRKPAILALLLAFSLAGTGCGIIFVGDGWNYTNYIGDWSGTYDFAAGDLVVEGTNGSITILAWDEEAVRAEARYTAKTADYLFSPAVVEEDGLLSLSPPRDRDLSGVSWTLQVPRGLNIAVRTSNGRISILGEGFGAVTADTSNGRYSWRAPARASWWSTPATAAWTSPTGREKWISPPAMAPSQPIWARSKQVGTASPPATAPSGPFWRRIRPLSSAPAPAMAASVPNWRAIGPRTFPEPVTVAPITAAAPA